MFERLKAKLRRCKERKAARKAAPVQPVQPTPEKPADIKSPSVPTPPGNADVAPPTQESPAEKEPAKETPAPDASTDDPTDLWQKALKSLPLDKQETLKGMGFGKISSGSAESSIDDLLSAVNQRQEECEKKFWKVKVGDNEIVLRNYTTQIVGWLQKAGDIAIQFAPPQASLPWSCLKSLMQIPVIEGEQMAALLGTTEKIVRVISRGQVYETVYLRSKPDAPTDNLSKNLESALTAIYTTSLELLADSGQLFNRSTASRTLQALLNPGGVSGSIAALADQEDELLRDVAACETRRSAEADNSMIGMLEALNAPLTRMDEGIAHLLQNVDEKERIEMLEWISPIPFGKHHNNIKDKRTSGTGEWLLQTEGFQNWEKKRSSVLFWLQGSPGTGKTYLTSTVIDRVQDVLSENPKDEGVAFFYCDKNEPRRSQPLAILQSFVRQLSTTVSNPESTQTQLRKMYTKNREMGSNFTFDQCREQILASLDIYQKSTLVIDAMDECDPDSRDELIEALNSLLTESKKPVKIFISSRPDPDIQSLLENTPNLGISADDNKGDIQKFLNTELDKLGRKTALFKKLKNDIINALLERCQGMFQWAALQVHQIVKCKTESSVWTRLENLPEDLQKAYDEAWEQVESLEEPDKTLTTRAMLWIMASEMPLTSSQLLCAVRVNTNGEKPVLADEIDEQGLLSLCNNLLTIDSQLKVWRFAHLSVREYLEARMQWTPPLTNFHAASACLSWFINVYDNDDVIHISEEEPETEAEPDSLYSVMHPFHLYMRHQWVKHAQRAGDHAKSQLARLLKTFLGSPKESTLQYQRWYKQLEADFYDIYQIPGIGGYEEDVHFRAAGINYTGADTCDFNHSKDWHYGEFDSDLAPATSAVFFMCHFAFDSILSDWWETADFDHTLVNSKGHSLLTLAARAGSASICKTLINRGANVNLQAKKPQYCTALEAAAHRGHLETVKQLVEAGADANIVPEMWRHSTALVAAVSAGHRDVVKCLVQQAGADVNLGKDVEDEGLEDEEEPISIVLPLATAARNKHNEIVKFLVEAGANINIPELTGNALAAAIRSSNVEAVKYLVQKAKADVNITLIKGSFGSPIEGAAMNDKNLEIVKILLQAGADANKPSNSENSSWGSPLIAAAYGYDADGSNIEIVKCLLDAGADVNKASADGTPLSQAVYRKNIDVIKVLLEAGADVDALKDFSDALESEFFSYAMYLIQSRGSSLDMSLVENKFGSALILAGAHDTRLEFLEYLVEGGADVNQYSEHGNYGTAPVAAARRGNAKALQYLIDAGADPKPLITSEFISTCMVEESVEWGQKFSVFKILLNVGADVNTDTQKDEYGSLLAAAAIETDLETVKYLVKAGADVNKPLAHGTYGSALAAATQQHDPEIVKYLVSVGAAVNVSLKYGQYGSPLAAAATNWQTYHTEFLLESGADVNMSLQGGKYGSALAAAAFGWEQSQIEVLLKAGADVNMPLEHGEYGSVLAAAVSADRRGIVKDILEIGADVKQQLNGRDFNNALTLAASISVDSVEVLIEAGAEVNNRDTTGRYGNALISASAWGQKECVELLIEKGADVNLKPEGSAFTSALQAAQSDVSEEDIAWIRRRTSNQDVIPEKVEELKTARAGVAELLNQHGATV